MKDIIEPIGSRIKSPVYGYFVLAILAVNWKSFFFLFVSKSNVSERIKYFEDSTSWGTLLLIPIIFSVLSVVAQPWLSYIFQYLSKKPTALKDLMLVNQEHAISIKKQELEVSRTHLLGKLEKELIERAERDSKIEEISDSDAKEKLKKEIEALRREQTVPTGLRPDPVEGLISIDLKEVGGDVIVTPPDQFETVQELLNWLFINFLKDHVPSYTYGEEWVLIDTGTKKTILSKGINDDRLLFDAGIFEEIVYKIELMK